MIFQLVEWIFFLKNEVMLYGLSHVFCVYLHLSLTCIFSIVYTDTHRVSMPNINGVTMTLLAFNNTKVSFSVDVVSL